MFTQIKWTNGPNVCRCLQKKMCFFKRSALLFYLFDPWKIFKDIRVYSLKETDRMHIFPFSNIFCVCVYLVNIRWSSATLVLICHYDLIILFKSNLVNPYCSTTMLQITNEDYPRAVSSLITAVNESSTPCSSLGVFIVERDPSWWNRCRNFMPL